MQNDWEPRAEQQVQSPQVSESSASLTVKISREFASPWGDLAEFAHIHANIHISTMQKVTFC